MKRIERDYVIKKSPKSNVQCNVRPGAAATCGGNSWPVTLKALANFSPGVGFETLGSKVLNKFLATLKELRGFCEYEQRRNSFRVASSENE
jgi:hypothetical protein